MSAAILVTIFYLFVLPTRAHAYLDPGTGSYITQILLGFVVGGLYMLKVYWNHLKSLIEKVLGRKKNNDQNTQD